ncbi:IPT/TIG domain-containing protein [Chondromyces crocatus]|uniref:VOC domain-containing protein n=1 Tax=Chondromyces crocatus TaxID=52 RepID=A0A0K1ED64_CHOCO|nr:IPT/TIG domain-containing protein [Chondromyces crocatus]AKT38815.1 uncharacterized protein CMC5_029610 [Chondromyces crocatus]
MRIHGVGGFVLYANDPEVLSGWYGRLLGVSFTRTSAQRFEGRIGKEDGPRLILEGTPDVLRQGSRDAAVMLLVDDLAALARRLEHRGIDLERDEEIDGERCLWIRDPEGRFITLEQAPVPREQTAVTETASPASSEAAAPTESSEAAAPTETKSGTPENTDEAPSDAVDVDDAPAAPAPAAEEAARSPEGDASLAEDGGEDDEREAPGSGADPAAEAQSNEEAADAEAPRSEVPPPPEHVGTPAPLIMSVRPNKLSSQNGGTVRILGANFAEGVAVRFGGTACEVRWLDSGLLEVDGPARAQGPCAIEVENPDGQVVAGAVLYEQGPTIARLLPVEGPPRGGTEVLVEGTGFEPGCVISFHGTRSPAVRYESATRVWFVTPAHDEGSMRGEVRLTNPDGLSSDAPEGFGYRLGNPRILGVSPDRGYLGGSKRITITGEDLESGCVGRIGGQVATLTWRGSHTVDLIVPPAAQPGPVDVEIENLDGQIARAQGAFTYELPPAPPKLIEVRPDRGYLAGGQEIHLLGDNFDEATVVRIGEIRVAPRLLSRNELVIETPARTAPGVVAIELVDGNGVSVRREDGFVYVERPAPRITGVTPRTGSLVGGTRVVVEGEHFAPGATVRIGAGVPSRIVVRSGTQIEILTPASREAGFVDVEISLPEAGVAVAKSAFRYEAAPPPVIESVAPNRGSVSGGTELSISGKGFIAGTQVLIGGKPAGRTKLVNATTIDATTPPGTDGQMVDVVVRNPDGKEAASKRAFQYDARYRG